MCRFHVPERHRFFHELPEIIGKIRKYEKFYINFTFLYCYLTARDDIILETKYKFVRFAYYARVVPVNR